MVFSSGRVRGCFWQCLSGHDEQSWSRLIDNLEQIAPKLQQGDVVLDVWHDAGRPTAVERRRFTELFEQNPAIRRVGAHAVVTNSAMTRGVLSAVNWVIKRPYDERIFSAPAEAVAWITHTQPTADTAALIAALEVSVPGWETLVW